MKTFAILHVFFALAIVGIGGCDMRPLKKDFDEKYSYPYEWKTKAKPEETESVEVYDTTETKFSFGEMVKVTTGFHKGAIGWISRHTEKGYQVELGKHEVSTNIGYRYIDKRFIFPESCLVKYHPENE